MTGASGVIRDERTIAVENAGYRLAYGFIAFALLLDVMFRSLMRQEAPWDLLAFVVLGGVIITAYQTRHRVQTVRSVRLFVFTLAFSAVVAALVAGLRLIR